MKKTVISLKKYFRKRLQKINHFLNLDLDALTTEAVHELRLEIKKIDALFDLVKSTQEGSTIRKYISPFKKVFRKAGKLRSIQVEFNLINSYSAPDTKTNYLHQLHEIKHERRTAFRKFINGEIRNDLKQNKNKIVSILGNVTRKDTKQYLHQEEKKVNLLMNNTLYREQELHVARKHLKRLYLNVKNITASNIDDRWRKILDLLGEWHDLQVACDQFIKAIYSRGLSAVESEQLHQIKSKLQHDKGSLFEQVVETYYSPRMDKTSVSSQPIMGGNPKHVMPS